MVKGRVLYIIAFMLMLSSLLLIVANNVPILVSFRWLWAPVFLLFTLLFNFEVFKTKGGVAALSYGLLYVAILQYSVWNYANDWYKNAILEDFYAMFVFVVFFTVLCHKGYFRIWSKLAKFGLLFLVVTGIMTIVATEINPMVVRASYSSGFLKMGDFGSLYRLGFGSYGYMAAVVALLPIFVYFLRINDKVWLPRYVLVLLIFFFYFVLLRAQIFANILVGAAVLIFSFLGARRLRKSMVFITIVAVIVLLIPQTAYVSMLSNVAGYFDTESLVHEKFTDMAAYAQNPVLKETDTETGAGSRASRYPALWKVFLAAPFGGDASYSSSFGYELESGGHLYWMSRLALWGVFGFVGYLLILRAIFKPVVFIFNQEFRFYYYLSLSAVITLGFMKNLSGREIYVVLLIIIPGLYINMKNA